MGKLEVVRECERQYEKYDELMMVVGTIKREGTKQKSPEQRRERVAYLNKKIEKVINKIGNSIMTLIIYYNYSPTRCLETFFKLNYLIQNMNLLIKYKELMLELMLEKLEGESLDEVYYLARNFDSALLNRGLESKDYGEKAMRVIARKRTNDDLFYLAKYGFGSINDQEWVKKIAMDEVKDRDLDKAYEVYLQFREKNMYEKHKVIRNPLNEVESHS